MLVHSLIDRMFDVVVGLFWWNYFFLSLRVHIKLKFPFKVYLILSLDFILSSSWWFLLFLFLISSVYQTLLFLPFLVFDSFSISFFFFFSLFGNVALALVDDDDCCCSFHVWILFVWMCVYLSEFYTCRFLFVEIVVVVAAYFALCFAQVRYFTTHTRV